MTTDSVEHSALVGIPQIAEIAGVGRSAVGNWRKRHPDFPDPKVQTPSGALFDLREVEDWLIEQGKISQRAPASARLWGLADTARGVWTPDDFIRFSVSCLVYLEACERGRERQTAGHPRSKPRIPRGTGWSDLRKAVPHEFLRAFAVAARSIEGANPELEGLLEPRMRDADSVEASSIAQQIAFTLDAATDDTTTSFELFKGFDDLESLDRFSGEYSTPADVATLMSRLVPLGGDTIFDPAVGGGQLLWKAAFEGRNRTTTPRVMGIDVNLEACRRSRSRFYLDDRDVEIDNANALTADPDSLPLADVVVLDPPYGLGNWGSAELYVDSRWQFGPPPPSSADFAWLQLASRQLTPTGRAAVLMGAGSLTKPGREGAIRQRMLEAGFVEGVIVLPPRLKTNTSIPLALWLLRSPTAPSAAVDVLLVDASGLAETGRSRYSLPRASIDSLVALVDQWREANQLSEEGGALAVTASVDEILAADASLLPARYRSRPEIDRDAMERRIAELRQSLAQSSAAASQAYADLLEFLEER